MQTFQFEKSKIPVKAWINKEDIEDSALKQLENMVQLHFAFHHVAVMPDVHCGYGVTIGSVLATENVIVPNAVGVDIGCGMCAVKTSLTEIDTETLKKIMGEIRKQIPVGFKHHDKKQPEIHMPKIKGSTYYTEDNLLEVAPICGKEYQSALKQIGTLGGGNHFIEIQKGSDDHIWIMIHSGSRNLGKQVADYYNKLAIDLNEKWYSGISKKWELAFLPVNTKEGETYLEEMQYCVDFALASRKLMMNKVCEIINTIIQKGKSQEVPESVGFGSMINIAHNYASLENHFGENVWVHRKGATLARKGTIGIIPGSQGSKSYIVKGLGNKDSFESCSHGAGRKMGRKEATKTLNLEDEIKKLDDMGVIHGIRTIDDLEEAVGAYKDIDVVMENQKDLVEILVELTPLAVIKG